MGIRINIRIRIARTIIVARRATAGGRFHFFAAGRVEGRQASACRGARAGQRRVKRWSKMAGDGPGLGRGGSEAGQRLAKAGRIRGEGGGMGPGGPW